MKPVIRPEQAGDEEDIRRLLRSVFEHGEWDLVDALRAHGRQIVSRVALQGGQVVGHILFSEVTCQPAWAWRGVGLAPLAVRPASQKQGIGSRLVQAGLADCAALGYDLAVVLGDPSYYTRFGFCAASQFGLLNTYGVDEPFMALALRPGALGRFQGVVHYAPEFEQSGN